MPQERQLFWCSNSIPFSRKYPKWNELHECFVSFFVGMAPVALARVLPQRWLSQHFHRRHHRNLLFFCFDAFCFCGQF